MRRDICGMPVSRLAGVVRCDHDLGLGNSAQLSALATLTPLAPRHVEAGHGGVRVRVLLLGVGEFGKEASLALLLLAVVEADVLKGLLYGG